MVGDGGGGEGVCGFELLMRAGGKGRVHARSMLFGRVVYFGIRSVADENHALESCESEEQGAAKRMLLGGNVSHGR